MLDLDLDQLFLAALQRLFARCGCFPLFLHLQSQSRHSALLRVQLQAELLLLFQHRAQLFLEAIFLVDARIQGLRKQCRE